MTKDPYRGRTGRAVVNEVAVRRMRFLHSFKGVPAEVLAQEYDIGLDACRRILHWKSWRHVSEMGPGATEADFLEAGAMQAKPQSRAEADEILASQKRLAELLGKEHPFLPLEEPTGSGLEKLQQEAGKLCRGDKLVEELTGHDSPSVVSCRIPATNGQPTDGGSDESRNEAEKGS